jgi:hypothetical protein
VLSRILNNSPRGRRIASDILCDQRAAEIAVKSISHQFFNDEEFLFRSISKALGEVGQAAELCAKRLVQFSNGRPTARPINCEQNPKLVRDRSAIMVRKIVDYAKALVRLRFGHTAQALAEIVPHLRSGPDAERHTSAPPRGEAT